MDCYRGISDLSICELAAIASSTAVLLSKGKCQEDLETLGNLVSTIGSMILTFASSECVCSKEPCCNNKISNDLANDINSSVLKISSQQQTESLHNHGD